MFSSSTADLLRRKRQLHQRIARSRRRIDRRVHAVKDGTRRLFDVRTYATHHPGWTLAAALGTSIAAAIALRTSETVRGMGRSLIRQTWNEMKKGLMAELRRFWTDPKKNDRPRSDND